METNVILVVGLAIGNEKQGKKHQKEFGVDFQLFGDGKRRQLLYIGWKIHLRIKYPTIRGVDF